MGFCSVYAGYRLSATFWFLVRIGLIRVTSVSVFFHSELTVIHAFLGLEKKAYFFKWVKQNQINVGRPLKVLN